MGSTPTRETKYHNLVAVYHLSELVATPAMSPIPPLQRISSLSGFQKMGEVGKGRLQEGPQSTKKACDKFECRRPAVPG